MKTKDPLLVANFNEQLCESLNDEQAMSASEQWKHIKATLYKSALEIFGKKEQNNPDWFENNFEELNPFIEAKRKALICYKKHPSHQNHMTLKEARRTA